jgi:hypothetical protein
VNPLPQSAPWPRSEHPSHTGFVSYCQGLGPDLLLAAYDFRFLSPGLVLLPSHAGLQACLCPSLRGRDLCAESFEAPHPIPFSWSRFHSYHWTPLPIFVFFELFGLVFLRRARVTRRVLLEAFVRRLRPNALLSMICFWILSLSITSQTCFFWSCLCACTVILVS